MTLHIAITGASSGIGAALAREYGKHGAKITVVARRVNLLEALAKEIGANCKAIAHDLSNAEHAADWIHEAEQANGPIDVLVNNAGAQNNGATAYSNIDDAERLLRLNLLSPLRMTHAVLPKMLARGSGTIVDVASVAALSPTPRLTWYGASKAGLAAFSESLRGELHGTGVHVVTVYPGPVKTPIGDEAYESFGGRGGLLGLLPEGRADVLARKIRIAVERKKNRIIYPAAYISARHSRNLALG